MNSMPVPKGLLVVRLQGWDIVHEKNYICRHLDGCVKNNHTWITFSKTIQMKLICSVGVPILYSLHLYLVV